MVKHRHPGFTLVELLVVLVIIATLLTIAVPRYLGSLEKSREAVLRDNLHLLREAVDHYYADRGRYPDVLADLVRDRYLRRIPEDPMTGSATSWVIVSPAGTQPGAVYDVRSGADGADRAGIIYGEY